MTDPANEWKAGGPDTDRKQTESALSVRRKRGYDRDARHNNEKAEDVLEQIEHNGRVNGLQTS